MIVTFVAPTSPAPGGGALAVFQFANALRRRGHDVHLAHIEFFGPRAERVEDITWFRFEEGIEHHFPTRFGEDHRELPVADFVVCTDDRLPEGRGLPLIFLQGLKTFPRPFEDRILSAPCPKVCPGSWLVAAGRDAGVPPEQLVHVPLGIDHEKYRVHTPIEDRPLQVLSTYANHPVKGPVVGLRALAEVARRVPDVRLVAFGTPELEHDLPAGMVYRRNPPQDVLVRDVYNQSRVYMCSSVREGSPMPPVEAMACGCALVTTACGGSEDFAFHGETALVSEPGDAGTLADHVEMLLRDDDLRVRIARQGAEFVARFDWDVSGKLLEDFLVQYAAEPDRYQRASVASRVD